MSTRTATKGSTGGLDPFTFEIIRHKLFRVIDEGTITLGKISGTPSTAEGHDVLVALYRADGSVMLAGVGFLHHLLAASQAVKEIVRNFGEDPGISENDTFFANDPYTMAMHNPDVFMISPIHFEGELVSWVVNFVHVTDVGGMEVGGLCPSARECYQEGFSTKGLKIVEAGKLRRDVFETFLNMIRDPGMTGLDLKSQMSANHVVKERMQGIYGEYGPDTVDEVAARLIEQSEDRLRARLRELPDGVWTARRHLDLAGRSYRLELAATKEADALTYDFTGTDPQADFPINCQYWATKGAALAPVFPLLAWDLTWNEGIARCIDVIAPEGTLLNGARPAPLSLNTVSTIHAVNILSNAVLSKMLAASSYHERAVGCWMGSVVLSILGGIDRHGEYVAQVGGDVFGMPEGARAFADGSGPGGHIVNVAQKMSNVEFEEQAFPKLFLYRRVVPDSAGAGMYRGGHAHEYAVVPQGGGTDSVTAVVTPGSGEAFPAASGVCGGYPGATTAHRLFRDGRDAALDRPPGETPGVEDVRAQSVTVRAEDVLYLRADGGGGYGDPLDRNPQLVCDDVRSGLVSPEAAEAVYGVVIADAGGVDAAATQARRLTLRTERLGREPRYAAGFRADVPRSDRRISEYLQLADGANDAVVECTWCGDEICRGSEAWKEHAALRKAPVTVVGPPSVQSSEYELREFFCPSCATSLDVEVARVDDPVLHDRIVRWSLPADRGGRA